MKLQAALAAFVGSMCLAAAPVSAQEAPRVATDPPVAAEPTLDTDSIMAEQLTISAGKGINISLASQKPSTSQLSGGVRLQYEKVIVAGESLDFSQSEFADSKLSVLSEGRLLGGPNGPTPDHVLFDTRETRLQRVGFRGLLSPIAAHITRQAPESVQARVASYRFLLVGLGPFAGELRMKNKWLPHEGWADHAVMEACADVTEKGLANPRLRSITFFGSDNPKRRAEIMRLGQQMKSGADGTAGKAFDMKAFGSQITVQFNEQGDLSNISSGLDGEIQGLPIPTN
ncbi:MAG: hypothetical protein H0W83_15125 [Planctomycetes bacterium]|nr:hypothetical protein [Planctomycetota bacterium]